MGGKTEAAPVGLSVARVAKCHRYDGCIRVKIFAGWSKIFGTPSFAKSRLFGLGEDLLKFSCKFVAIYALSLR